MFRLRTLKKKTRKLDYQDVRDVLGKYDNFTFDECFR